MLTKCCKSIHVMDCCCLSIVRRLLYLRAFESAESQVRRYLLCGTFFKKIVFVFFSLIFAFDLRELEHTARICVGAGEVSWFYERGSALKRRVRLLWCEDLLFNWEAWGCKCLFEPDSFCLKWLQVLLLLFFVPCPLLASFGAVVQCRRH